MRLSKEISTIRILSVPSKTTIEDISQIFLNNRGISLARTKYSEELSQTATVTFPDSKAAKRALGKELRIRGEKVYLDNDFSGLTVLYSHTNAVVDIISVHGLNGHAFESWALGGVMWLRDFLPTQLQSARIMTWGYSAGLFSTGTVGGIGDFAKQLLSDIDEIRTDGEKNRPIIFVCHSLGGIVVKRALNFARVEERNRVINDVTVGVVFLATPHQGGEPANYGNLLGLIAKVAGMREVLVKDLRRSSVQLAQINDEFRQHHKSLKIGTFFELKKTKIGLFYKDIIVDRTSGTLGIEQEEQNPLDQDHSGICKFEHRENKDYKKVLKQIQRMAKDAPATVELRLQPAAMGSKQHFLVPYSRNPAFVGRETILDELQKRLSNRGGHQRIALYGLGGVGKTQITIEYSYRCKERTSVFWVYASNPTQFERGYRKISKIAKLPGYDDEKEDILASTKDWLESPESENWILILDNADNLLEFSPEDTSTLDLVIRGKAQTETDKRVRLLEFIPQGSKGTIIITTRDKQVASELTGREFLRVGNMNQQEGEELLIGKDTKLYSEEDLQALPKLLDALEYLPLAIAQAAAFMSRNYESPRPLDYLTLLNENRVQLLSEGFNDMRRPSRVPEAVMTTWYITFDHIQNQCPLAANLLKLIAFLDRQGIPKVLLRASELEGSENGVEFETAVGKLTGFSLLTESFDRKTYEVHSLVHLATKEFLSSKARVRKGDLRELERDRWAIKALEILSREFPGGGYELASLDTRAVYLPHALAVIKEWDGPDEVIRETYPIKNISLLSYNLGWYLRLKGNYGDAKFFFLRSLKGRGRVLDLDHPEMLETLSQLSIVLQCQGRYNEAEEIVRQVLETKESVLGPEHPSTLTTLHNLADVLRNQGRYHEAEVLNQRVLEAEEKVLSLEDPRILTTLNNLAGVLLCQGKYREAEETHRRVLRVEEKVLDPGHPDILTTLNNLAIVLQRQGKYSEAEATHRRVLETKWGMLGLEHPSALVTLHNLAVVLRKQNRYSEAEEINQQVLEGREKSLGPEHPDTLTTLSSISIDLRCQGRYSEAKTINRRVLEARGKALGPEHPETLITLSNLASILEEQGEYREAEEINRRVLEAREKVLGPEHPSTLTALNNLALVLQYQEKYSEAEEVNQRVLEVREKVLGSEHPDTLLTLKNMAGFLRDQGRHSEAEVFSRRVLGARGNVLGSENPSTLIEIAGDLQKHSDTKE